MNLTSLLTKSHCFPRIIARRPEPALRDILRRLQERDGLQMHDGASTDIAELVRQIMEREKKGSTALGSGVGYPHIRYEGFGECAFALATCPEGMDYMAPDGQPVRLLFLAIVPPDKNFLLLGVGGCLARIMGNAALLNDLVKARTAEALWERLDKENLPVTESLRAGDIMEQEFPSLPPDMTLSDVATFMHKEHKDALPVVGPDRELLGEVTGSGLLATCLPPRSAQMSPPSVASNFGPFEHFFRERAHTKVSEILQRDVPVIGADAPMAEVVARIARGDVPRLYVVEDGRLVGVINSFTIIDKVLSI